MKKSYEELMGSVGRERFFRPERRRVRDLLSQDAQPKLLVAGCEYRLFDISMNGLSFISSADASRWQVGRELVLSLTLHGKEVYQGAARVARTELDARGARVGLALSTGFLDLPEIRRRDEEGRLEHELTLGPEAVRRAVPTSYWNAVADAVHFVQFYKQSLRRHEARYRAVGPAGRRDIAVLAERALAAIREPWKELSHRASIAALECLSDPTALRAAKQYTETVLTPLLLDAPMVQRSYTKPLGYPGDYQVMIYYYNNALEGESVSARVFHKLFVEHPLSNGVRTRCRYVVELMEKEHARITAANRDGATFRVTSLGCGPARESALYAQSHDTWPGDIVWTLIDQEEETLSVAFRDTQVELARSGARGVARCLNVSFAQMLTDATAMPLADKQDFIFSTGLFDYLRESRAQQLLHVLYHNLKEGGLIAIGNAIGPNEHFWAPEFILDWTLLYRTREEMARLASSLPRSASIELAVEPGEAYYFLFVRKHA